MSTSTDYARWAEKKRAKAMPQLTPAGRFWSLYLFGCTVTVIVMFGYGYVDAIWRAVMR